MTLPRGSRSAALAAFGAALALLLSAVFAQNPVLRALETQSLDLRFRLRGPRPPGPEVTVILVDDVSLQKFGRWPLPRTLFAEALQTLDRAHAKVVAFDLLFAEPDEPLPADLRAAARAAADGLSTPGSDRLRSALEQLAESGRDARFAGAIAASRNVLLPIAFSFVGEPGEEPDWLAQSAYARFDNNPQPGNFPLVAKSATLPIAGLATKAAGLGHTNVAFDRDRAPRFDYVALPFETDYLPSLPVRAAAQYLGLAWPQVALGFGRGVRLGSLFVPTDAAMRLLINYRGPPGTFPTFSFADVVAGRVPADRLAARIVLVGASFTGSSDSFAQPFGQTPMPGVERLANIVDTILGRHFIATPTPPWQLLLLGAVLLMAALAGTATEFLPTRFAAFTGLLPIAAWAGATQAAFVAADLWLPLIAPVGALTTAAAAVLLFRYWVVDREGRLVRAQFRQYLAPELVDLLAAQPERLKLGGDTRMMTMMFCDVRGFTAISEGFKSNPHALTQLINRFLTPMTDIIMAHGGTIDKYMGDCIMAFWNAPLDEPRHAGRACETALAMMQALAALNRELVAESAEAGRPFRPLAIGIGINSGECVVGNMGSSRRFDYSVIGDAVNLASRLESQSKTYGVCIVLGEETREAAPDWAAIELDRIAVKGKQEAVAVYTLMGDPRLAESAEFRELEAAHRRLLARYREQDWAGAAAAIAECRRLEPDLEALYDLYQERIGQFMIEPPGPDWDGVHVATEK